MGNKNSKQVDKLYKEHGEQGLRSIMTKQKSPYQSLSYSNIHRECMDRVAHIQDEGDRVINDFKEQSQKDYETTLRSLTAKDPNPVKKAEARSRTTLKQAVGFDQEMEKYQDIRRHMKQNFEVGRQQMQNDIRDQTRINENSNISKSFAGYDDQPEDKKRQLLSQIQDNYGKKWIEKQQNQRKSNRVSKNIYQFNFSQHYKQRFDELIPTKQCTVVRNNMKHKFQSQLKQALGLNPICC